MKSIHTLRKNIRSKRNSLNPTDIKTFSQSINQRLIHNSLFRNSQKIAIYFPVNNEVDTKYIIRAAWGQKKKIYLPVLVSNNQLRFAPYHPSSLLIKNRFGIPEPAIQARQLLAADSLDLVIAPLVAFDANCARIGMGGGFYDRTFSFLQCNCQWKKPKLIAVAFELQRVTSIIAQEWDLPMHTIISDQTIYKKF